MMSPLPHHSAHLLKELEKRIEVEDGSAWKRWTNRPLGRIVGKVSTAANRTAGKPRLPWKFRTTPFFGLPMEIYLPEIVSRKVLVNGFFEADLSRALIICLRPGGTFYDVGAHFGYFTLLAATLVGSSGAVYAFEPTPASYARLSRNAAGLEGVTVQNLGVYSSSTTLEFKDYGPDLSAFNTFREIKLDRAYTEGITGTETKISVNTCTLDAYAHDANRLPDFVKIDAESAELEVLAGMQNILRNQRPIVSIEVGDVNEETASASIIDTMTAHNYAAFEFSKDGRLQEHRRRDKYRYDNFLFVPGEKKDMIIAAFEQHASGRDP